MTSSRSRFPGSAPPRLALVTAAVSALVLGVAACSGSAARRGGSAAAGSPNQLQNQYERTIDSVQKSVVQISTSNSTGSGVVYDNRGDIVTNAHVVGDANTVMVREPLGNGQVQASVVGTYPPDDLAVVRVHSSAGAFTPADFGNSENIPVGEIVLAMGNPLGLSDSVTQGIVSATGRSVGEGAGSNALITDAIQTSAAINPGNSGGALVNLSDQVIGIPTLAARLPDETGGGAAPGIGFAIPSDTVKNIAGQLIRDGRVTRSDRASLGITAEGDASSAGNPDGVEVASVDSGGTAAKAGVRPGDVIVGLDRTRITSLEELETVLAQYPPGTRVTIHYMSGGAGRARTANAALGSLSG